MDRREDPLLGTRVALRFLNGRIVVSEVVFILAIVELEFVVLS